MIKFIKDKSEQRGALMIEAIALLGLMTMMSPMIVRQTADRTAEMEEVAIAGQVKSIKEALQNYIEAQYQNRASTLSNASATDQAFTVTAADLAPYLPATYLSGGNFKGNKLVDGFDVGVRAQCAEARLTTNGETCGTTSGGMISNGLSATCKCTRYKMTGMVVSNSENNMEIDDRRAARIAQMLGADGGYMRTSTMVNSISNNAEADIKKVLGSQGMWEAEDVSKYVPTLANTTAGGKIAAATIYSSGLSGDYLYRKKVDGLPDANSMFTDLDMGGNGNCVSGANTGGCNRIDNAGGLEVIGGRILIRARNGTEADNQVIGTEGATDYARIALATDDAHMKVTGDLNFDAGDNVYMGADNLLDIESGGQMAIDSGAGLNINSVNSTTIDAGAGLNMYSGGRMTLDSDADLEAFSTGMMSLNSGSTMSLNSGSAMSLTSVSSMNLSAGSSTMRLHSFITHLNSTGAVYVNARQNLIMNTDGTGRFTAGVMRLVSNTNMHMNANTSVEMYAGTGTDAQKGSFRLSNASANLALNGQTFFDLSRGTVKAPLSIVANNSGGFVQLRDAAGNNTRVSLEGNTGMIRGAVFQPEVILNNNARAGYVIRKTTVTYNNMGYWSGTSYTSPTGVQPESLNAAVGVNTTGTVTPYNTHSDDATKYNRFRVDPAFISVMNDIKLTSRGGARLSEALPNYITKGIYELTNSYRAGPWPCASGSLSNCSFRIPYRAPAELGMSSGGWEHNCSSGHPWYSCSESTKAQGYITVSYYSGTYQSCPNGKWCFAHPFMGVVPAPGRAVSTSDLSGGSAESIAAYDEGTCPNGYQAVMTLTPTTFELGRVSYVDPYAAQGNVTVAYNPGWSDYSDMNNIRGTGVYQPATKLGIFVKEIKNGTKVKGWAVAMGTVTWADSTAGDYLWNFGGVDTDSWSAYAHTYCYFNPSRFTMPNMYYKTADGGGSVPSAMDNPNGTNN